MPTSYPLSVQQCQREAEWEVGGGALSGPAEMRELVDRAGHALVSMAPWRWLNGRQARLRTRASHRTSPAGVSTMLLKRRGPSSSSTMATT